MPSSSNGDQIKESDRMRELNCQYRKQVSEMVQLNTKLQMRFDELVRQKKRLLMLPEEQQELDQIRGQ